MDKTPNTDERLAAAILKAMHGHGEPAGDDIAEAEQLALAAEGRLDELPEAQQDALLRRLGEDPAAGATLAALLEMRLDADESDDAAGTSVPSLKIVGKAEAAAQGAPDAAAWRFGRATRGLFVAWAAAACLLAGAALWRFTAPPADLAAPGAVQTYSDQDSGAGRYWDQFDSQRLSADENRGEHLRELVLAGSIATSLLLSAALIISICRDHARRGREV